MVADDDWWARFYFASANTAHRGRRVGALEAIGVLGEGPRPRRTGLKVLMSDGKAPNLHREPWSPLYRSISFWALHPLFGSDSPVCADRQDWTIYAARVALFLRCTIQ